jgi:hypothetical protein
MGTRENLALARDFLDNFSSPRGIELLLDSITEDAVYKLTIPDGTPLSGEFRGREGMKTYFQRTDETVEILELNIHFYAAGDETRVVAIGDETLRVKKNDRVFFSEWATVFTFRDDKIARILVIEDCSAIAEAYADRAAPAA